jgi:hypothetical protein
MKYRRQLVSTSNNIIDKEYFSVWIKKKKKILSEKRKREQKRFKNLERKYAHKKKYFWHIITYYYRVEKAKRCTEAL